MKRVNLVKEAIERVYEHKKLLVGRLVDEHYALKGQNDEDDLSVLFFYPALSKAATIYEQEVFWSFLSTGKYYEKNNLIIDTVKDNNRNFQVVYYALCNIAFVNKTDKNHPNLKEKILERFHMRDKGLDGYIIFNVSSNGNVSFYDYLSDYCDFDSKDLAKVEYFINLYNRKIREYANELERKLE